LYKSISNGFYEKASTDKNKYRQGAAFVHDQEERHFCECCQRVWENNFKKEYKNLEKRSNVVTQSQNVSCPFKRQHGTLQGLAKRCFVDLEMFVYVAIDPKNDF